MKRSLFFLILTGLSFSVVYSQVDYGLKIGLHFSQVDEVFDGRSLPATTVTSDVGDVLLKPQFGAWMSIPLSERLSLQPELLWTQKAWNQQGYPPAGDVLTFDYFSFPLAIAYHASNWRFTLGPELTYLFSNHFKENAPYSNSRDSGFIQENEFGAAVNLGLQYHYNQWIFGLRASRNLNEIPKTVFTDAIGVPVEGFQHYHQGMTLWAGYELSR